MCRIGVAACALLVFASACIGTGGLPARSFDETVTPEPGTLIVYSLGGGECPSCGWTLSLDTDGSGTFETETGSNGLQHDADALAELIDETDPHDLVGAADDCMREADGDAPLLTIAGVGRIDRCYAEWHQGHPLLVHLESIRAAVDR